MKSRYGIARLITRGMRAAPEPGRRRGEEAPEALWRGVFSSYPRMLHADRAGDGSPQCLLHRISRAVPAAQSGARWSVSRARSADRARAAGLRQTRSAEHTSRTARAGARMKLAANLLLAVFWQALGEAPGHPLVMNAERAIDLLADRSRRSDPAIEGFTNRRRHERRSFGRGDIRRRHDAQGLALHGPGGNRAGKLASAGYPHARMFRSRVAGRKGRHGQRGLPYVLDRGAKAAADDVTRPPRGET